LTVVLAFSFLLKELLRRFRVPVVVSQILAGILLGLPLLKSLVFSGDSLSSVELLSQLGITFLLFLAGWEIDFRKVIRYAGDVLLIAFSSALLPFVLGFLFIYLLYGESLLAAGYDPVIVALVFGVSLSVTSEATKVKVLADLGKLKTKLAAIMLGAGTLDDIIEVLALASVLALVHVGGGVDLYMIPVDIILFGLFILLSFKVLSNVLKYVERKETDVDLFLLVLIIMFGMVGLSDILGLGYLIGAIAGGFTLQWIVSRKRHKTRREKFEEEEIFEGVKLVALSFLAPFFFLNIGLNFSLDYLFVNPLLLAGALVVAFAGKILGTLMVKPFTKLTWRQLYLVGWAMNSRGAVELIIALTAYSYQLIPGEVFSILVVTSLATTLTFPFVIQRHINRNPKIMD